MATSGPPAGSPGCAPAPTRHTRAGRTARRRAALACLALLASACGDGGSAGAGTTMPPLRDTRPAQATATSTSSSTSPTSTAPTTTSTVAPLPHDPGIVLHATPDFDQDQLDEVVHGLTAARHALGETGPVDVFLYDDPAAFAHEYTERIRVAGGIEEATDRLARGSSATVVGDRGLVFLNGHIFRRDPTGRRAFVVAAHEAVHTVQLGRSRLHTVSWSSGTLQYPSWLIEGHAELLAWNLAVERGALEHQSWEEVRRQLVHWAVWEDRPLADTTFQADHRTGSPSTVYGRSTFAAEWLAHHAGPEAFWVFWETDAVWSVAFEWAFGLSVEDFYAAFAAWEADEYPALTGPPAPPPE